MREIKFRAYDKDINVMVNGSSKKMFVITACLESTLDKQATKLNYELMQYTGLKDKNGVEIYEGDIVRWLTFTPEKNIEISEVVFKDGSFDIKNFAISLRYILLEDKREFEVIGNIYENKELLK